MTLNPFEFGIGAALLALGLVSCVVFGVPTYFWVIDKRRRGEPIRCLGLLGPMFIGICGAIAIWHHRLSGSRTLRAVVLRLLIDARRVIVQP